MRKRKKSEEDGFNVWRSYSDMMAGVLLLFILIMCVTLFQAQKSYNESIKERDDKIALQEQYTAEILAQQSELDEKNSKLSSQDEQLDKQKKLLAELAAQLKEQQASLDDGKLWKYMLIFCSFGMGGCRLMTFHLTNDGQKLYLVFSGIAV